MFLDNKKCPKIQLSNQGYPGDSTDDVLIKHFIRWVTKCNTNLNAGGWKESVQLLAKYSKTEHKDADGFLLDALKNESILFPYQVQMLLKLMFSSENGISGNKNFSCILYRDWFDIVSWSIPLQKTYIEILCAFVDFCSETLVSDDWQVNHYGHVCLLKDCQVTIVSVLYDMHHLVDAYQGNTQRDFLRYKQMLCEAYPVFRDRMHLCEVPQEDLNTLQKIFFYKHFTVLLSKKIQQYIKTVSEEDILLSTLFLKQYWDFFVSPLLRDFDDDILPCHYLEKNLVQSIDFVYDLPSECSYELFHEYIPGYWEKLLTQLGKIRGQKSCNAQRKLLFLMRMHKRKDVFSREFLKFLEDRYSRCDWWNRMWKNWLTSQQNRSIKQEEKNKLAEQRVDDDDRKFLVRREAISLKLAQLLCE